MGLILQQIEKARERAEGVPLERRHARDLPPAALATPDVKADRADFLRRSLRDPSGSRRMFERIMGGNELQEVAYLERGAFAARSVCRIAIGGPGRRDELGSGTGFLIAPGVLITNNHVFPDPETAAHSRAQFDCELDTEGLERPTVAFRIDPQALFFTSDALDFTVVHVGARLSGPEVALADYGHLPLVASTGKVAEGEWLTVIQHPGGERKQLCVRENRLIARTDDVLWYSTDTLGGSSGAPVFNNDWYVVALHHSGVPEERDGRIQTVDGQDFIEGRHPESAIKWIANEGIRVSRIVATLKDRMADHPLLAPVFAATPGNARLLPSAVELASAAATHIADNAPPKASKEFAMPDDLTRSISVTLDIHPGGRVTLRGSDAHESFEAARKPPRKRPPDYDVPFDATYADRKGFETGFLGGDDDDAVHLPGLGADLATAAAPLIPPATGKVLDYHNLSLVMHAERRFAIYTAANVDFSRRYDLARPSDVWRTDPRISAKSQIGNFYYRANQFDRGHLTRREDMEYGDTHIAALQCAADTCHWTNCTPQHSGFNQTTDHWQGLERHILESAIKANGFRAQIFTGPLLEEDDPVWDRFPDIRYPVRFWKVAVAKRESGPLFAAAFLMDQSAVIGRLGIEHAGEAPFGPFELYQVPIAEIERLTGLSFGCGKDGKRDLSEFDPLRRGPPPSPPGGGGGVRRAESFRHADAPAGYVPLSDFADMIA